MTREKTGDAPAECRTCGLTWDHGKERCPECRGFPPDECMVECPVCKKRVDTVGAYIAPHAANEADEGSSHALPCAGTARRP